MTVLELRRMCERLPDDARVYTWRRDALEEGEVWLVEGGCVAAVLHKATDYNAGTWVVRPLDDGVDLEALAALNAKGLSELAPALVIG